jgi:hypothetical protein
MRPYVEAVASVGLMPFDDLVAPASLPQAAEDDLMIGLFGELPYE